MEATGIYWEKVYDVLCDAGIDVQVVNAQHVKQLKGRKTDIADSIWLSRICQFAMASPSLILPKIFRDLRGLSRYQRTLIEQRAHNQVRIQKVLDRSVVRIGGVLSRITHGVNGRRILEGIIAGETRETILRKMTWHVRKKITALGDALSFDLDENSRWILSDLLQRVRFSCGGGNYHGDSGIIISLHAAFSPFRDKIWPHTGVLSANPRIDRIPCHQCIEITQFYSTMRDLHPLQQFDADTDRIDKADQRIAAALAPFEAKIRLLEAIPGVCRESAMAILIELGPDMSVFPSARNCAAWAGLCPGNNESAGKRRNARTRRGNPALRAVLVECAHAAARTKVCQFQGYHEAVKSRRGYKRAIVATAHKMLRIIHAMLRDGKPYVDPGINYEEISINRKASRWLRKLEQYGHVERLENRTMPEMSESRA